jgi:hypothetical protein
MASWATNAGRKGSMRSWLQRFGAVTGTALALLMLGMLAPGISSGSPQDRAAPPKEKEAPKEKEKTGLLLNDSKAFQGYTVLNPMNHKTAYLLDMDGRVVKTWQTDFNSMHAAYLLPNGHLLRSGMLEGEDRAFGAGPGASGRFEEIDWDGNVVWDFKFHNAKQYPHHDIAKMPNDNVLIVVWDKKTADEAVAAGRKKELVSNFVLPDSVVEFKPTGKNTAEIVWEWHLWDHLIQDVDASKPNYGDVASHPELVDLNFVENPMQPPPDQAKTKAATKTKKEEEEKLKSLGYVGSPAARGQRVNPDWTHVNAIDYNPELDQIVISIHEFSEIWIIDHGTTTAEAASHKGGKQGKGGDLLYRWGNPRVYRGGTAKDQRLFAQHNAQWIRPGLPGAGHLLVFNNGNHRSDGDYSSVDEIILPVDAHGRYAREEGKPFGPEAAVWSYSAPKKSDFYSFFISGAQRLPNGNTLICSGANGTVFEVTPDKEVVWKYVNPVKGMARMTGGPLSPPPPNQLVPFFFRDALKMSPEQRKSLDDLQKRVDDTLGKTLTAEQKKRLEERRGTMTEFPQPGQFMAISTRTTLRLSADQRKQLDELQKDVDQQLEKLLTAAQKKQFQEMKDNMARGPFGGPPPGGPGGPPPGGPPGGPGGPPPPPGGPGGPPRGGFRPPSANGLFRAYRYGPDYPALAGKELKPGKTVDELQPKEPEKKKSDQ